MLMKIGKNKGENSAELGDRIVDCHARIRNFLSVARKLAASPNAPAQEIKEAAQGVRRYFTEALPRHVVDEDESIKPRLLGRDANVDAALNKMTVEHKEHDALVPRLIEMCGSIADDPARAPALSPDLATLSERLEKEMLAHLELEEQVIVPAIRALLTAEEKAAIGEEMSKRRG